MLRADGRARAEQLASQGRHRDAIDVLTAANRQHRDPEIEQRLVELRRDAQVRGGDGRRVRPRRRVRDRFRGIEGLPEISREQLDVDTTRSAILRHGGLLVRGLLDPAQVQLLVDDIDRTFDAYDAFAAGAPLSDTAPWFVPFEPEAGQEIPRDWIREGGGVAAVDSPRTLFDLIEIFDAVGVRDLVTKYLGEPPTMLAKKWTLRRVAPLRPADWHQDGAFMGRSIHSIDVWVALSHCGVDAPGLEIVARRFDDIVETGTEGAHFDWSVGPGVVERVGDGKLVRPVFAPGDAMIFDHLLLHRTLVEPEMTRDRHAIETWFAAPSTYRPDVVPIDQHPIAY